MAPIFTPTSPNRRNHVPKSGDKSYIDSDNFSGPSWITVEEFDDMWVAGATRQLSLRPKSPSPEERMKRKQERYHKGLIIALNTYTKRNMMQACQNANHATYWRLDLIYSHISFIFQLNELEIVEEKGRNQVDGSGALYVHSNFLVKGLDGKTTLFFAETHPECTQEEDVVVCAPLEENSYGHCFGCDDRAKELKHPSGGGYLGGLDEVFFHFDDLDSDDDCFL
ncbi:hypothetical protein QYE76_059130 [Lolium multiflorum]|uniref:DUF3615 domain-containing protein n=1 Tax=Lolium multiflorum TaxID=4521 RepID=A0AAD8QE25_LOLMU|nr:hypothetical protein QYE76_059130 [Lolium multiflorum]